eukprot:scaffold248384_cov67-Cyclotella_meneghiniana.AAC.3
MFVADTVRPVRCQLGRWRGAGIVGMEWHGERRMNGEGGVVGCLLGLCEHIQSRDACIVFGSPQVRSVLLFSRTLGRCFLERTLSGLWADFERTVSGPAK